MKVYITMHKKLPHETSIDVLPSKNQALCEYCTLVSKLNISNTLISLFPLKYNHVTRDSSLRNT